MKKKLNKNYFFVGIILLIFLLAGGLYFILNIELTGLIIGGFRQTNDNPVVLIETTKGDISLELYPDKAPITVENFLNYVDSGFYDGLVFHRVINGFMIQGGGFSDEGFQKQTNSPIKLESDNGLLNERGTIAMARTPVPDSATSQFFINSVNNDFLNYNSLNDGYAVFGKVISGMDIVDEISKVETGVKYGMQDWPVEDVVIIRIVRS